MPPANSAASGLSPAQVAQVAQIQAEVLLDRYGLVTRGSVGAERGGVGALGNFSAAYRVLSAFEEVGRVRRGYFVDGLGAAQFAADGVVDRLRSEPSGFGGRKEQPATIVLAATDQEYGDSHADAEAGAKPESTVAHGQIHRLPGCCGQGAVAHGTPPWAIRGSSAA